MRKHSRGPWVSGVMGTSEADTEICYVRTLDSDVAEMMATGEPDICICQGQENAKLIAASPMMLTMLLKIAYDIDGCVSPGTKADVLSVLRDAHLVP